LHLSFQNFRQMFLAMSGLALDCFRRSDRTSSRTKKSVSQSHSFCLSSQIRLIIRHIWSFSNNNLSAISSITPASVRSSISTLNASGHHSGSYGDNVRFLLWRWDECSHHWASSEHCLFFSLIKTGQWQQSNWLSYLNRWTDRSQYSLWRMRCCRRLHLRVCGGCR